MNKFIYILGGIVAIGLIAWGFWFFAFSRSLRDNNSLQSDVSLPAVSSQSGISVPVQNVTSPENPEVVKDFLGEIQNPNQIAIGGTVVAPPYALQIWGDSNEGGEGLLKDTSSTGWTLVSLGGGQWTVFELMQEGVPLETAEQLTAGLGNGVPAPASPPTNIPDGNTITIGTSEGSVTMNNFYKDADYITQDQQSVVIQQASTYDIVYNVQNSSFTLSIFGTPFETIRQTAEASLLKSLGISQQDACKLGVYERVSGSASSQYVGQSFPLSFCAAGAFGQ